MCSLNDNDIDEDIEPMKYNENNEILDDSICQKCKENKATVKLRDKDVYCQMCFEVIVTHKFRATLGKSKIVRPNDKVLVAHSGKGKSISLLNLIKAGMHESVHKRLIFQTQVIYIDDGIIKDQNIDERQRIIGELKQQISKMGFDMFVLPLSESLSEHKLEKIEKIQEYLCTKNNMYDEQLVELFKNLANNTSKEDLLKKLRLKAIVKVAKLLRCKKIFLADNSTSLSINILTNISLGRGAQLSLDVGFIDNRYGDELLIMRPLRDFTQHEVDYYMNIHKLEIIEFKKLSSSDNYESIRQITKKFVNDLNLQFNSTVSTIFRVSDKVSAIVENSAIQNEICILCNAPLDTSNLNDTASAINATAFSKLISSGNSSNIGHNAVNNCGNGNAGYSTQSSQVNTCCGNCVDNNGENEPQNNITVDDILMCLCYGCRLIFRNNTNKNLFPKFLIDAAKEQICLKTMRDQITNFLL